MSSVWIVALFALVVGAIAGYAAALLSRGHLPGDTEKRLQEARDRLNAQQLEINSHFTRSAELLGQLTASYQAAHNHIAQGAARLCDRPGLEPLLPLLGDDLRIRPEAQAALLGSNPLPPLDYAPKTPNDRGVLREDFGLDRPALETPLNPTELHAQVDDPTLQDYGQGNEAYTGLSASRN